MTTYLVNPPECIHVDCTGEERCLYVPEPIGPRFPELVLDREGRWWRSHSGGGVWWYGSSRLVTWNALRRMLDGLEPLLPSDTKEGAFPWGPWVGADYGETLAAEERMRSLTGAAS